MEIRPDLARFLAGPVLMTLGTRDGGNRPMIARGSGAWASGDRSLVRVLISEWLWPETAANLRDNGRLALTVVQPADYRAFQLKGRARLRPATAEEVARAVRYVETTRALLLGLGVPAALTDHWLCDREVVTAELAPEQVFEQTPGPRAGAALG